MPQTPRNMSIHTVVREDIQPAGQCAVPVLEEGNHNEERNEIYLGKIHSMSFAFLFIVFEPTYAFTVSSLALLVYLSVCDLTKIQ